MLTWYFNKVAMPLPATRSWDVNEGSRVAQSWEQAAQGSNQPHPHSAPASSGREGRWSQDHCHSPAGQGSGGKAQGSLVKWAAQGTALKHGHPKMKPLGFFLGLGTSRSAGLKFIYVVKSE